MKEGKICMRCTTSNFNLLSPAFFLWLDFDTSIYLERKVATCFELCNVLQNVSGLYYLKILDKLDRVCIYTHTDDYYLFLYVDCEKQKNSVPHFFRLNCKKLTKKKS